MMDTEPLRVFRVVRDDDRTRVDTIEDIMGWGVQFPSGACHIDWNRQAYAEEDRLDYPHISLDGTDDDVEQGTGGTVEVMDEFEVGA